MDIPPRLSEQQKFVLAWLRKKEQTEWKNRLKQQQAFGDAPLHEPVAPIDVLSWAVAREFNTGHEDRIFSSYQEMKDHAERQGLEEDSPEISYFARILMMDKNQKDTLTDKHCASLSRSLARLSERGLIEKQKWYNLRLTDNGRDAAEEIIRCCEDGRYSLSFENLPAH